MENVRVLGYVDVGFDWFSWLHVTRKGAVAQYAYNELVLEALKQVDVVNIRINGSITGWMIFKILFTYTWPLLVFGNGQNINAYGDVVLLDGDIPDYPARTPERTYASADMAPARPVERAYVSTDIDVPRGLEKAIVKVCSSVMKELPEGSKIAVLDIAADHAKLSAFVLDEVQFNLVNAKRFTMVDRENLDKVYAELKLTHSGDFDEKTIKDLGKLTGASVIITGSLMKSGRTNRLSLKALNAETAAIITMARESY